MIRELPLALLLLAGVVRASSVVCSLNHRCVYYHLCIDGFINTDGTGLIDPRTPEPVPDDVTYARCERIGTVCCRHPDNPDGPDEIVDTCPFHQRCVSTKLCINGEINTSGVGLIDVRVNDNPDCTNPEYTNAPAVCCRKPYPAETCPETNSCVPRGQCNGNTTEPKGTYIDCFLDDTQTDVGVCCDPLGVRETCSSDGSLECVENDQCIGIIPLHENGNDVECYVNSELTGVCCKQPLETCPENFVCLSDVLCKGNILDETGASVPHHQAGSWQQCLLSDNVSATGVCCTNPSGETELPPADVCGVRHNDDNYELDTRIKNTDYQAHFAEFPWQGIIFFTNFTFKCGASLIGDQWLLTAAHCVDGFQPSDFQVRLGEWQVNIYDEPYQYRDVAVAAITVHPDFNNRNLHNDIAVIQLVEPIQFTFHINTVCLPEAGQVFPAGTRCFATGWGKDAFEGQYQVILKKVDVPLVEHGVCQHQLGAARLGYYFVLDQSFICAGGEKGKDACTGDGGGPLACLDPDTDRYVLAGITAWGLGCGVKDAPGVYVNVQYFQEWVVGIIDGGEQSEQTQSGGYGRK